MAALSRSAEHSTSSVTPELPTKLRPLFTKSRYKIVYGGRGGAKSWGVARALLLKGWEKPLRVLCTREIQKTIADSVHRLLSDQVSLCGLGGFYRITDGSITGANGTEFLFTGIRGQDIAKIKSFEGVDICWVEEGQAVTKRSWDTLIPTIRKPESEIWVTFNPELDTDETYERFIIRTPPEAVLIPMSYRDNPWFPDVLEKERVHLLETDREAYENVWEGHCRSSVEGAIYGREISAMHAERRFRPVPYDPMLKVHTVWDLGWNDATAIVFAQRLGSEMRVIDYIEDSHKTLADYVAMLEKRDYRYGFDFLPHDGAASRLEAGGISAESILTKLGRSVRILPARDVETGIKAARLMFPRCYFDQDRASGLVDALKRYKRSLNVKTGEFRAPVHDDASHGADAFRKLAEAAEQMTNDDGWQKRAKPDLRWVV